MNTDNWKTAINGRDNKRRAKGQKSNVANVANVTSDAEQSTSSKQEVDQKSQCSESAPKQSWADMSEPADVSMTLVAFNQEMVKKCASMTDQLAFVSSGVTALLNLGLQTIQQERARIGKSENEKNMVRDLHEICSVGRNLVTGTSAAIKSISSTIDSYEAEKNRTLDELKSFLATLDVEPNVAKDQAIQPISGQKKVSVGRYAAAASQDVSTSATVSQNVAQRPTDMVSIQLGNGNLVVPIARNFADIQPMSIKFAQDLGVFLINLGGKVYSFCDGTFIQRTPKSGDNTLFGKRCNPNIAHCAGATCTYYHDPLIHANGHTRRNMGVHYVVSELIGGVSTAKEIGETARGRNQCIVEDLVQLGGMLLIKAFMVQKMRESLRNH